MRYFACKFLNNLDRFALKVHDELHGIRTNGDRESASK